MTQTLISNISTDHVEVNNTNQTTRQKSAPIQQEPSITQFLQNFFSSLANTNAFIRLTEK